MVVHEAGRVVGYYGLAPTAVVPAAKLRPVRTGQPPSTVPCLLFGQLATHLPWAGRGVGTGLLRHALLRSLAGAELTRMQRLYRSKCSIGAGRHHEKARGRLGPIYGGDDAFIRWRIASAISRHLVAASAWSALAARCSATSKARFPWFSIMLLAARAALNTSARGGVKLRNFVKGRLRERFPLAIV